jgi:hypothetical protein
VRRYTVHLLFHLLAIAAGAACGIAGGLWWFGNDANGLWLAIGALVVGIIVLVLESLYISADQQLDRPAAPPQSGIPMPPQHPRERTRPDLDPAADTLLQPSKDVAKAVDQETKTSAVDALNEEWNANPASRRP